MKTLTNTLTVADWVLATSDLVITAYVPGEPTRDLTEAPQVEVDQLPADEARKAQSELRESSA